MNQNPQTVAPTTIVTEFRTTMRDVPAGDDKPFVAGFVTASGFERRNVLTSQIASL